MTLITTKYRGPRGSRGGRIVAKSVCGSCSIPYPYAVSGEARYRAAAYALLDKLAKKHGVSAYVRPQLLSVTTPGNGCAFVVIDDELASVIACARKVVEKWPSKELSQTVRALDLELADFDIINPKAK